MNLSTICKRHHISSQRGMMNRFDGWPIRAKSKISAAGGGGEEWGTHSTQLHKF